MRDVSILAAMLVFVPLAIRHSFIAYVLWAWTAAVSLNYYLYGFMISMRFNFLFACIALFALASSNNRTKAGLNTHQKLLLVFLVHATVCCLFAYPANPSNSEVYEGLAKALIFSLVMPAFVTDRLRIHVLLVAIAIGLGFHGVVEGTKFIATAGGHKITGIPTSMMSDNNHFAVGQLMVMPILFYLQQYASTRLVRMGFMAALIITAVCVMGTFSRGGFIGLAALGSWFLLASRRKILSLAMVGGIAIALVLIAPEAWFARIDTINNAGEDSSFMTRVAAWKVSTMIALHNPFIGGGFHAVQSLDVWSQFREQIGLLSFVPTPEAPLEARAAHSIYFEVLGDTGFVGLLLFLAIWLNAWRTAGLVKKIARNRPDLTWARDMADMLRLSLLAYAVSGAAVSMGYFEIFYAYGAIIAVLRQYIVEQVPEKSSFVTRAAVSRRTLLPTPTV